MNLMRLYDTNREVYCAAIMVRDAIQDAWRPLQINGCGYPGRSDRHYAAWWDAIDIRADVTLDIAKLS